MAKIIYLVICAILLVCVQSRYTGKQDYDELADDYDDNDYDEEDVGEVKRNAPYRAVRNDQSGHKGGHEGNTNNDNRETMGYTRGGFGRTRKTLKILRSPAIAKTPKVSQTSYGQKGRHKHANGNGRKTQKHIKRMKPKGNGIKPNKVKGWKRAKSPFVDSHGRRKDGPLLAKWRRANFPLTAPVAIPRMAPVPEKLRGTVLGSPSGHQGKRYDNLADEYDDDESDEEGRSQVERDVHHRTTRKDDPDDDYDDDDDDDDDDDYDDFDDEEELTSTSIGGHGQIKKTQQVSSSNPVPTKQTGIVTTTQTLGKGQPTLNTEMLVSKKGKHTNNNEKGRKKQKGKGNKNGEKQRGKGGKWAKNHSVTPTYSPPRAHTNAELASKDLVVKGVPSRNASNYQSAKEKFTNPTYTVPKNPSDTRIAGKDLPVEGNPTGSASNSQTVIGHSVTPIYTAPKDTTGSKTNTIDTQGNYVNVANPEPKSPISTGFSSNELLSVQENPVAFSTYNNVAQGISLAPTRPLLKKPTNIGLASNSLTAQGNFKDPVYTVPTVPFDTGFANNDISAQGYPNGSASNNRIAQGNVEAPTYIVPKVPIETGFASNDISAPENPTGPASNNHIAQGNVEAPTYMVPTVQCDTGFASNVISTPGNPTGSAGNNHIAQGSSEAPMYRVPQMTTPRTLTGSQVKRHLHHRMVRKDIPKHLGDDMRHHRAAERSSKGMASRPPLLGGDRKNLLRILSSVDIIKQQLEEMDTAKRLQSNNRDNDSTVSEERSEEKNPASKDLESSIAPSDTASNTLRSGQITTQPSLERDVTQSEADITQPSMSPSSIHQPSTEQSTMSLPITSLSSVLQQSSSKPSGTTPCSKSPRSCSTVAPIHHESVTAYTPRNMSHRSLYAGFSPEDSDHQFDYDEELIEKAASLQKRSAHKKRHIAVPSLPAGATNTLHLCLSKTYNGATSVPLKKTDMTDTVQGIKSIEKSLRLVTHRLEKGFTTLMDQMTDFANIQRTDIKANGDKIFTLKNSVANSFDDLKGNISKICETHANISNIFEDSLSMLINESESAKFSTAETTSIVKSTTAKPPIPDMKSKNGSGLKHKSTRQLASKTKGTYAVKSNAYASDLVNLPDTKDKILNELIRDEKRRSKKTNKHSRTFHNDHSFLEKFKSNPEIHENHDGHLGHGSHSSHARSTLPVGLFRKILRNAARERGKSLFRKRHLDRKFSNKKRPRHLSRHGSLHSRHRNMNNIFKI